MKQSTQLRNDTTPNSRPTHAAFTLLELLVSIAIIGILASLLTVAVVEAVKKARGAKCVSNLRQVGIATAGFLGDTGEYPVYLNVGKNRSRSHEGSLERTLDRYLGGKAESVWVHGCPSAREPDWWYRLNGTVMFQEFGYNTFGIVGGYWEEGMEVFGLGTARQAKEDTEGRVTVPVREGMVVSPSSLIAYADSFAGEGRALTDGVSVLSRGKLKRYQVDERTTGRVHSRHGGRMNIAFADGHVEGATVDSIFENISDDALRRWNRDGQPHRELLESQQ